jgi:adenine-specific DNA-methyltransferase
VKVREQVSAQKLRGGFYTPDPMVHFCLSRLRELLPPEGRLNVIEPSAGDGAFVRGIAADGTLAERVGEMVAIEPLDLEARKCRSALARSNIDGRVLPGSAIDWGIETDDRFNVAVGNPPFLRYQFISASDKVAIPRLGERIGISFAGVSNLWLGVFAAALSRLGVSGAFSFVVPTELLTGLAASRLREWVSEKFGELRVDLFAPGSFPGVLQEVAVFSGRRLESATLDPTLTVGEHDRDGVARTWTHAIDPEQSNWTRYLLEPGQLAALDAALASPSVSPLGSLARFQVSIVTGANDFFSVSDEDVKAFELEPWSKPLLPRIRHATGLVYSRRDQTQTVEAGARAWLLDFSEQAPDPLRRKTPARYLQIGEERDLHRRYKCRIREPWFRVPQVERGQLLLSKRSHRYPRMIVNAARAYTTDTIYRGVPRRGAGISSRGLSASFHSSLTLLTAELEGRSFGGGVLELVPSEIGRLAVARAPGAEEWIERLDAVARGGDEEALVRATDDALIGASVLDGDLVETLSEARMELLARRLERNERREAATPDLESEKLAA